VIAIAHRLSTIARMDRSWCWITAAFVEEGTHAELLAAAAPMPGSGSGSPAASTTRRPPISTAVPAAQ